jgi:hypothetical protein
MINARNNYWVVADSTTQVYSSATNTYVPVNDLGLSQWKAAGNTPGRIVSEAELWVVLAQRAPGYLADWLFDGTTFVQPLAGAYSKVQLAAYSAEARYVLETKGITVSGAAVATDRESQAMVNGAYNLVQANPSTVINFKTDSGFVSMNAATITALAVSVGTHVQAAFAAEASADAQITAGTITTPAGVDAVYAAITA